MKNYLFVAALLAATCWSIASKPMESVERYNVVLVHGAADRWQGLDCDYVDSLYSEAYGYKDDVVLDSNTCVTDEKDSSELTCEIAYSYPSRIGGIKNPDGKKGSSATGMVKELASLLRDTILETPSSVYLQRPFVHPAGSPASNGDEIGKSSWAGENKCSTRRSLIEEAQQFKAKGADTLKEYRESPVAKYRIIPSRNILVSHSMGGVASREYVQGDNYNHDVDKVITLDSPHRGTYSLDGLIHIQNAPNLLKHSADALYQKAALTLTFGLASLLLNLGPVADNAALNTMVASYIGIDAMNTVVDMLLDFVLYEKGGFDYYRSDSLYDYIFPGSDALTKLNGREWPSDGEMLRILYSEGGVTFGSPDEYGQDIGSLFIPDGIYAMVKNAIAQLSHTEIDNPAYYNNVLGSILLGYAGGLSLTDHGSILIPHWSGAAEGITALESANADVVRVPFAANENASKFDGGLTAATIAFSAAAILVTTSYVQDYWPQAGYATRAAVALASSLGISSFMIPSAVYVVQDMMSNHENPSKEAWQRRQYKEKTYSGINGKKDDYKVLLLEDFLYERPFVNLGLFVSADSLRAVDANCYYEADSSKKKQLCEIGLYGTRDSISRIDTVRIVKNENEDTLRYDTTRYYNSVNDRGDSIYYGPFNRQNYSAFKASPLKFSSSSDWSKIGVKIDRWERVDGLKPDGSDNPKGVPIRHVERYEVPAITVDNFIEKYSFIVDDLMPHRLRQIRMNFNYQEEIAWECDITKPEGDGTACSFYKREPGKGWDLDTTVGARGLVPHPVKKNGQFDFEPRKFGIKNLSAIQKDNQNTVTISTVNKIGLSNTQRFYYLFKATDDYLKPVWPVRDAIVNRIQNFEAFTSVLDYQGFHVVGMRDSFWTVQDDLAISLGSFVTMDSARLEVGGRVYASRQEVDTLTPGEYHWTFNTIVSNQGILDSSDIYDVPFTVDVSAPKFKLSTDNMAMNPDSSTFIARFTWDGEEKSPDIRAMRWVLEKMDGSLTVELPAMYDVSAKDFAVAWNSIPENMLGKVVDGLYRIKALAVDYAAPSRVAYDSMNVLVNKIAAGNVTPADWSFVEDHEFNVSEDTANLVVDRSAPNFDFSEVAGIAQGYGQPLEYDSLPRPRRNDSCVYVSADSLLRVDYTVSDSLLGRDSSVLRLAFNFVRYDSPNSIDRAGDSLVVKKSDGGEISGLWVEMSEMLLGDDDYVLRVRARDDAGNSEFYDYGKNVKKKVRIDRTAPQILSLVSDRLVYRDVADEYGAKVSVSESGDMPRNREGMLCYYKVSGADANNLWNPVSDRVLHTDSVRFRIEESAVGVNGGLRYLTVACIDAAGNVGIRADVFHVGDRYPQIISPVNDTAFFTTEYIPIVGVAAPSSTEDELTTVYRLRYRLADSTADSAEEACREDSDDWQTENVSVIASNRSIDSANISRVAQSSEGVLGYLHNVFVDREEKVCIELSVRGCETCKWRSATSLVSLSKASENLDSLPQVKLELSTINIEVGKDSLDVALYLEGFFPGSYHMKVYAEDENGKGLFETSVNKVYRNLYGGTPVDTSVQRGVWFYEEDGIYHLVWKGLGETDSIKVSYNSETFGNPCVGVGGGVVGCSVVVDSLDYSEMSSVLNEYLNDFPEWMFSSRTDSAMVLFGAEGHVVIKSSGAFRVGGSPSLVNAGMPVYFGSEANPGYGSLPSEVADVVNPWYVGWSVTPGCNGLSFTWNGEGSVGDYPAAGKVRMFVEVTQNEGDNAHVALVDTTVDVTVPDLYLAIGEIPEFYLLKDVSASPVQADSAEIPVYVLGSMNIPFTLKYRDAYLRVSILDADGVPLDTLLDSAFTRASSKIDAHSVSWNPVDSVSGILVEAGTYSVKIEACSSKTMDSCAVPVTRSFKVTKKNGMKNVEGDKFYVSEARDYGGHNLYEPFADFLVKTNVKAKYLPVEKRKGTMVDVDVSGTQKIYGYAPERFSLAIKRHRKDLDLVVAVRYQGRLDEITGSVFCEETGNYDVDTVIVKVLSFSSDEKSSDFVFSLNYEGKGRGFNGSDAPGDGTLDIAVLTVRDFISQFGARESLSGEEFETAKGLSIWNLQDYTQNSEKLKVPGAESDTITIGFDDAGLGCGVEMKDSVIEKSCTYGDSGTTEGYNPNRNLFSLSVAPNGDRRFYQSRGEINSHCGDPGWLRYRRLLVNIIFEIPDPYWNAPFGMDNLVNRTVRFDHANKTIYGNGTDGYWEALKKTFGSSPIGQGSYFDGTEWRLDPSYGLLTPFEVQHLPFLPANMLSRGLNTFLFADEDSSYMVPSYFDLKFYGPKNEFDNYQVNVEGTPIDSCDSSNVNCGLILKYDKDSIRTPLLAHGNVSFYVGRNTLWSSGKQTEIPFPVKYDEWRGQIGSDGAACGEIVEYRNGSASCYKYYSAGSRVHFYPGDYSDSTWLEMYTDDGIVKNAVNSLVGFKAADVVVYPGVDLSKSGSGKLVSGYALKPKGEDYENGSFFIETDSIALAVNGTPSGDVTVGKIDVSPGDTSYGEFNEDFSKFYVHAVDTVIEGLYYRHKGDSVDRTPTMMKSTELSGNSFCEKIEDAWVKDAVVDSVSLLYLDSSDHSHFKASVFKNGEGVEVSYRDPSEIRMARPKELVEIRGKLSAGQEYGLSYYKNGTYYHVGDFLALDSGDQRITWFDVNRLQGATQFMLTWGVVGNSSDLYYNSYDLYVGKPLDNAESQTIASLFGDLQVIFPAGTFGADTVVTVRTAAVDDYPFEVFGDIALTGPVVEVLPRHDFGEGPYPRVQMVISRAEMDRAGVTPQTLKLFKVDFEKGKLVPLTNALYGYLKKDGSPAVGGASADTAGCTSWDDVLCYDGDWAYVMVSAETKTFSVFVAVDSVMADIFNAREDSVDSDSSTYPTEIACRLPQDSLWLGLENGYMAYAVACNQPVRRNVSLYLDDSRVVDILMDDSDTLRYDGTRKSGGAIVGKIASGIYDSRIRASSATDGEIQLAGPQVHTDSARPVIGDWTVRDSVDVLDRIFEVTARVHDDESGVAKVAIIPVFGTDTLDIVFPEPDGQGNVSAQVRLPRDRLARCFGCRLNLNLLVEDFGHNHDERVFRSDSLYPYPVGLALWYPAREGSGSVAHEFTQGEHDQDLSHVSSPWQSDAGIYFGNYRDYSEASTIVDLGFANAYSFEARLRVGYSDDKWRRVLGFSGVNGLNIELQNRGRALRLVEGANVWNGGSVLSEEKTWNHVVVAVDSQEVRFYVDGALASSVDISGSAVAKMDRELYGKFSFGNDPSVSGSNSSAYSYIGHVADIRMYTESVSSDQVYALYSPVSDDGSPAEIVVASVGDVTGIVGFEKRFSCSVAGNNYYVSDRDDATISVDMAVTQTGAYNVVLYARSTEENDVSVYVGESSLLRGSARFSTVWRAVTVSGVSLNLPSGRRTISVKVPEGVQIAGIALTSGTVASTSIPWGHSSGARKVHTYLRYESGPSPAMLLPRIRMENVSRETLDGFSIRYYFRGENPANVAAEAYFPQEYFRTLSVHAESQSLGYVEWNFYDVRLAPGEQAFYGQGPHFGIHNYDWSPWDATDDPSYVDFSDGFSVISDGFVEDIGIIVLDSDNNLVGGSCVEMEDEISPAASPAIYLTLL